MSDFLIEPDDDDAAPAGPSNALEVTVSELSGRIKRSLEDGFGHVRVRGELGRVSRPRSGHVYLDLKDDKSVLAAVIWRGVASNLRIQPEEGMEVVAEGRITTYPGQSKYQLIIERLAPAGVGALMAMLEERKKKLAAEGLFAEERKRPIPFLPEVIGVVTSPSGAVIRDILHRLSDRFPRHVLVWPVAVQGEACAPEVARAVKGFNALAPEGPVPRPDVLIVARGGGSLEDLWGFNEEVVARAVADSEIPVISAVGHETDTTLIDYVSDRRAPTPTAAAEMAVPVRGELLATLAGLEERRERALSRGLEDRRSRLRDMGRALPRADELLELPRQRLDAAGDRLPRALLACVKAQEVRLGRVSGRLQPGAISRRIETAAERVELFAGRLAPALARATAQARERFDASGRLLEGFSYKATLERGYAAVRGEAGVLDRADKIEAGAALEIEFADGRVAAVAGAKSAPPKRRKPKPESDGGSQGSLF